MSKSDVVRRRFLQAAATVFATSGSACLRLSSQATRTETTADATTTTRPASTPSAPAPTESPSDSRIVQRFDTDEPTWRTYIETGSDNLYIDQTNRQKSRSGEQACVFVNGATDERFVGGIETPADDLQDQRVSFWFNRKVLRNDSRFHSIGTSHFVPSNATYSLQENPSFDVILKRQDPAGTFKIRFKEEERNEIYQEALSSAFSLNQDEWYKMECHVTTDADVTATISDERGTVLRRFDRKLREFTVPTEGHTRFHRWSGRRPNTRLWVDDIEIERV